MSKRRKKTRGNPAKQDAVRLAAASAYDELTMFMRQMGEEAMEKARGAVLARGATEAEIDELLRQARLRIAYEALEVGQMGVFEWVIAPVVNEFELMEKFFAKAEELGMES